MAFEITYFYTLVKILEYTRIQNMLCQTIKPLIQNNIFHSLTRSLINYINVYLLLFPVKKSYKEPSIQS